MLLDEDAERKYAELRGQALGITMRDGHGARASVSVHACHRPYAATGEGETLSDAVRAAYALWMGNAARFVAGEEENLS